MKLATWAWSVLPFAALSAAANAQCINIEIGCNLATVPPAAYGAISGQWGTWNSLAFNPVAAPLVDTGGFATTASATAVSTFSVGCGASPFFLAGTGEGGLFNDHANVPALPPGESTTWTINGLTPLGTYNVYIYAWSPTAPLTDVTAVTKPSGGAPVPCGGWNGLGLPTAGGAYIPDLATAADAFGSISFTIAPFGASPRGCLNGIQIVDPACSTEPVSYCVASANSLGCAAYMTGLGTPSATAPDGFVITANELVSLKPGLIFYGVGGAATIPFQCATLCVRPPLKRTGVGQTGGTPSTCDGSMSIDWNSFIFSSTGELGEPWSAGDEVWTQYWGRDVGGCGSMLTNALYFTLAP